MCDFLSTSRAICLAIITAFVLVACGGGGSGGTGNPATPNGNITMAPQTKVISAGQASAMTMTQDSTGAAQISVPTTNTLAANLQTGNVVHLQPGQDDRYPLGLAGKVSSVSTDPSTGKTTATLQPVSFVDVVAQSSVATAPIALNSTNFVGAISPAAVKNATSTGANVVSPFAFYETGKTALNGAITFKDQSLLRSAVNVLSGASVFGNTDTFNKDTIVIGKNGGPIRIKLADMGLEASKFKPYGGSGEAAFEISGAITGLQVVENHETRSTAGVVTGLKSMKLQVKGTINAKAELTGGVDADLDSFSQAWKEVEDETFKGLGVTAQLTGLSSKEKIGKYPLTGLVFSVPCPSTCPIATSQTQTPVRAAKELGIIVWVYLTAKGKVVIDGTLGLAKINNGQFALGIDLPEGGTLTANHAFTNGDTSKHLMEAPYFDGDAKLNARTGISLDADFFVLGVHMANAALDMMGQVNTNINGKMVYATYGLGLGQPWAWSGNACVNTNLGAGVIGSAQISVGANLSTDWRLLSTSVDIPPFSYAKQFPEESKLTNPGWNDLWYAAQPINECYPVPVISTITYTRNGQLLTIKLDGTNLPSDLALGVSDAAACTNMTASGTASSTSASFSCTLPTCTAAFTFRPSSIVASNMTASAVSSQLRYAPSVKALINFARLQTDNKVLVEVASCPGTAMDITWPDFDQFGDISKTVRITTDAYGKQQITSKQPHPLFVGQSVKAVAYNADNIAGAEISQTITDADLAVSCTPAVVGQSVVCAVTGSNLLASGISVSAGSYSVTEDPGGTATRRVWRFTPTSTTAVSFIVNGTGGKALSSQVVSVSAAPAPTTSKLPDTGITPNQCYAAGSNALVDCTSVAATDLSVTQDGMVGRDVTTPDNTDGKLGFSYSLVARTGGGTYDTTECVRDNITGLTWEGKPASGSGGVTRGSPALNPNGTYTNYQMGYTDGNGNAVTQTQVNAATNTQGYVNAINAAGLCGYSDWRLPTAKELQTLVDYGVAYPGPTIDGTWFANTQGNWYWTSSPQVGNSTGALGVYFYDGFVGSYYRYNYVSVRLVR